MTLWACLDCSTAYAVGLEACPHCGGTSYEENGMAKITRLGGASVFTPVYVPAEEESSPGNSSETSSASPQTSDEQSKQAPRKRARTTGSRSSKGRRGTSTARSTDTSGPADD